MVCQNSCLLDMFGGENEEMLEYDCLVPKTRPRPLKVVTVTWISLLTPDSGGNRHEPTRGPGSVWRFNSGFGAMEICCSDDM